ncbi:hypothetical protein ACLEPN_09380 [Myxococcus sp. 1LA]
MSASPAWAFVHPPSEPRPRASTAGGAHDAARSVWARDAGDEPEQLWQLFIDSGYFNLAGRSAEWFESRRAPFLELGRRASHLPGLLKQAVWRSERGVEATLSVMKPYRATWLVHQLARRQGGSRIAPAPGQMLRDLYAHAVAHAQGDPGIRWLASYIESTVPFVQRTHLRFARHAVGEGLLLPLKMLDVACAAPGGMPVSGFELQPPNATERALFQDHMARTRPAAYVDALDLGPDALGLDDAARPWREAGLERERHLLVARRHGRPQALAVLEVGPPGANPFQLLDSVRLFPLSTAGRSAFPVLLNAARHWFARKARDSFVFLAEAEGDADAAGVPDDTSGARPYLWLIPATLASAFVEHVHEQTVHRLLPTTEKEPS